MRSPLPKNKIVGLAILGVVLTAGVAAALAVPSAFTPASDSADLDGVDVRQDFQPAVQPAQRSHWDDDHDEHEDDDDDD